MVRERDGSSSSSHRSRRKRKRSSDVTTTSSTIYILTKDRSLPDVDNEPEYSAGDNDCSEAQEESRGDSDASPMVVRTCGTLRCRLATRLVSSGSRLPRVTRCRLVYDEPGSSSSPMHMLGPKDEQMQRVFDKHRSWSLGTASSPPPVVSLRRLELSPLDSTDDSFMKDLKRRRSLKARFSDDLCGTVSTRCSVSR
ncbi:hypothetical protein HPB52_024216 [Rhipicephalus sanguineus]|uniref:Uncharacterized protein n=1 Tax=Rhipicephalus sanguineus TaxID=34632 RepID=A0A9D4TCP6_RHISA|nr:hypothetical protein HPB52_024216 [Rhipicephalus sanguineus]